MIRKEELKYIKEVYEEPDGYLYYTKFSEYVIIFLKAYLSYTDL